MERLKMNILEKIYNVETDQLEIIEREATIEEELQIEQAQKRIDEINKLQQENDLKRTAILAKLGITEEEAKLLLG